ncbi:MAG: MBL fold metallo-hydrolase [Betaproteobacteria bacterium]|nr:MBL fold metallo-hydrolase [Betaproteobacteria bacterium]
MRFASLGSGSEGNALVVEVGQTRIMLDCGFGLRDTCHRLANKDLGAEQITAILLTHEHADHLQGAVRFARKYNIPLWMTHGTQQHARRHKGPLPEICVIDSHQSFQIGDIFVQAFPVPHDAREPVQYVFSNGRHRLGVLTDVGAITPHIVDMLNGCDALVLECNHDTDMLRNSPYPPSLKQRIGGQFGHLDNQTAARLLTQIDTCRLHHLIAAHLSQHNNTPQLALASLAGALGHHPQWLDYADQANGFAWRHLPQS